MRLGVALEGAQLHVLLIAGGGLLLELIEAARQRAHARLGDLGVVLERAHQTLVLDPHLRFEIGDLGAQFLDAGMAVEQRRGLLRQLRPQGDALLGQAPHQLRIGNVGELDRSAGAQRLANELGLGFGIGLWARAAASWVL